MQFACRAVNGAIHSHDILTIKLFRLQFDMILLRDCKILFSHPIICLVISDCHSCLLFPGAGQTGKTTAHLMPWNDDYYFEVEKNWGTEKMKVVADSHRSSIDFVERVIAEEGIECNFKRIPGYLVPFEDTDEQAEKIRAVSLPP